MPGRGLEKKLPIYKKGEKYKYFRAVCLSSTSFKVLTRIIKKRANSGIRGLESSFSFGK